MSQIQPESMAAVLEQVVTSVFETMLGMDVMPSAGGACLPRADSLTATVLFSGGWSEAVVLESDRSQARQFAARFLSRNPEGIADSDVRDVLGELCNMIGGNLKCAVAHGATLSVPAVAENTGQSPRQASAILSQQTFQCPDGEFRVALLA